MPGGGPPAGLIVAGVAILAALAWFVATFNALTRLRNFVKESWAGIDTELRRRYDLIPNLVQVVKGYAAHEQAVFERVAEARTRALASEGAVADQARDENALVDSLKGLFAVAEGYPDLKASRNFLALQLELANTEDRIQAARRFYNANVRDLNTRIEVVPSNLVASMFGFQKADFFEVASALERAAVPVNLDQA